MKSYYVITADFNDLKRLKKSAKFFERYKHRAIVVTNAEVPTSMIVKSFDGDISGNQRDWYLWVHSSIVEDLHHEFLSKAPIPQAVWTKAVKKWEAARSAVTSAQENLRQALEAERDASVGIVRVNGLAPLVLNGTTYDPCSYVSGQGVEVVSLRERRRRKTLDTI